MLYMIFKSADSNRFRSHTGKKHNDFKILRKGLFEKRQSCKKKQHKGIKHI